MFSLTPRSAKSRRDIFLQNGADPFEIGISTGNILQPTGIVSTTFIEKVMTHYEFFYIFTKVVTLTLNFTPI